MTWVVTLLFFAPCLTTTVSTAAVYGHEIASKNIVKNWGFESNIPNSDNWLVRNNDGTATRMTGAKHTGQYGVRISGRFVSVRYTSACVKVESGFGFGGSYLIHSCF